MQTKGSANQLFANGKEVHLSENKRYHFLPTDDRLLLGATSFEGLQSAMRAIAEEAKLSLAGRGAPGEELGRLGQAQAVHDSRENGD